MSDPHDWSGEAGGSEENTPDEHVVLPVGIKKDGELYKELFIEQMSGVDDHNIATKAGGNGAKSVTYVLARCIQEVPGLLARKQNPEKLFDLALARAMSIPDRDYVLSRIYMLGGRNDSILAGECPRCERIYEENVLLTDLPVIPWPEDDPWEIPFTLEVGSPEEPEGGGATIYHKEGVIRFPTGKDIEYLAQIKNPAQMVDATLAACITQLGTLTSLDQERMKRLKSQDRQLLMTTVQRELPGFRQWKEVQCTCGRDYDVKIDLTAFLGGRRKTTKRS